MKLDFVCIGAQKAGTTTLHNILKTHPDIYLPHRKEAQFFDINEMYEKGIVYFFKTFFNSYNNEKLIGNINPNLQLENRSIDRLIESFGRDIKVIFMLRNPVQRSYSHYLMSKRRGYENLEFLEALKNENHRIENPSPHPRYFTKEKSHFEKNHLGYLYRSDYLRTLKYLFSVIDSKNIKIVLFEDFVGGKEESIQGILQFLKMPPFDDLNFEIKSNPASKPKNNLVRDFIHKPFVVKSILGALLSPRLKELLKNKMDEMNRTPLKKKERILSLELEIEIYEKYFRKEIDALEKFLNLSLDRWRPNITVNKTV